MEQEKLRKEFLSKRWGQRGLNELKKAPSNWHDGKMKRQHWKHTESTVCLKKTSPTFLAITQESIVGFT